VLRSQKLGSVVDDMFRFGKRYSCGHITVVISSSPKHDHRQGLCIAIAGKRIGNAVIRNRARRVIRECTVLAGGPWPGFRIAIVARGSLVGVHPQRVAKQLSGILRKEKVI